MKSLYFTMILLLSSGDVLAAVDTCAQKYSAFEQELNATYKVSERRLVTNKVIAQITAVELSQLQKDSKLFQSLPASEYTQRYALQNKAKLFTRAMVARAGYPILNPETGSPFDAVIASHESADGFQEYTLEVRGLLIFADPRPHLTIWLQRNDTAHNPMHIVSYGVMANTANDYVSWMPNNGGGRVTASVHDFLVSLLPAECKANF